MHVVVQSPSLVSSLRPHGLQLPGLPVPRHLPKLAPVHVHCIGNVIQPISSSAALFCFCPQSFPASESFQMSQLFFFFFASDGQSIGVSASASVLPINLPFLEIQLESGSSHWWFRLDFRPCLGMMHCHPLTQREAPIHISTIEMKSLFFLFKIIFFIYLVYF